MVNENRNVIYVNGSLSSSSTLFPCLQCKVISQPSAYEEEKFSRHVSKRFDAFDRFRYWELPHMLLAVPFQYPYIWKQGFVCLILNVLVDVLHCSSILLCSGEVIFYLHVWSLAMSSINHSTDSLDYFHIMSCICRVHIVFFYVK